MLNQLTGLKNRRAWTRYPTEMVTTSVITSKGTYQADVHDESYGGIALVFDESPPVPVGEHVHVLYYGTQVPGKVRRVLSREDGRCFWGIEWYHRRRRRNAKSAPRKREADYAAFGGSCFICDVVAKQDGNVLAKLPDGTTIEIPESDLLRKKLRQRRQELRESETEVCLLVAWYGLGRFDEPHEAVEAVLDFEFATRR